MHHHPSLLHQIITTQYSGAFQIDLHHHQGQVHAGVLEYAWHVGDRCNRLVCGATFPSSVVIYILLR